MYTYIHKQYVYICIHTQGCKSYTVSRSQRNVFATSNIFKRNSVHFFWKSARVHNRKSQQIKDKRNAFAIMMPLNNELANPHGHSAYK